MIREEDRAAAEEIARNLVGTQAEDKNYASLLRLITSAAINGMLHERKEIGKLIDEQLTSFRTGLFAELEKIKSNESSKSGRCDDHPEVKFNENERCPICTADH